MTDVYTLKATMQGFAGAPGYYTFRFTGLTDATKLQTAYDAVHTLLNGIAGSWLNTWTATVSTTVQINDMATGLLTGEAVVGAPGAPLTGILAPTAYAGGSGAFIGWKTALIFAGRRVQGRTFFVPLVGIFENDGTLTTAAINMLQGSGNNMITNSQNTFSIWHKTFSKPTDGSKPVQIGGAIAPVTQAHIKDSATQLRSRR